MGQSMRVGQRAGLQLGMRVESGAEGYDDLLEGVGFASETSTTGPVR